MEVKELLKERYFSHLHTEPTLVGVELEFPIIRISRNIPYSTLHYAKDLLTELAKQERFIPIKYDASGRVIELEETVSKDHILYEVAYTTLEFAFAPEKELGEIEKRFQGYLDCIQPILALKDLTIAGLGVHPDWQYVSNLIVETPHYEMLTNFLKTSKYYPEQKLHHYPTYGAFIMGSQVQFDVSKNNVLDVLNTFNQIEAVKASLFPHSPFPAEDWKTNISRDIFWEKSMHGYFSENIGVFPRKFKDLSDYLDYLAETSLFTVKRGNDELYFKPLRVKEYFAKDKVETYNEKGKLVQIHPEKSDINFHRAYHYQDLTTRGTVELRSVCSQELSKTWIPVAFQLGLRENIQAFKEVLQDNVFYDKYGENYPYLRTYFSKKTLSQSDIKAMKSFSRELILCSIEGLKKRGYGEERFLEPLRDVID